MRLLTPSEQREIERLKNVLLAVPNPIIVEINDGNREMWLNALEMVLQTQEAMKAEWYQVGNRRIDAIQAVEYKRNDNE